MIRTEDFDCGIMISASHNPYYDNGIKVMNGNGEKLEESVITEIEKYLDGEMEEIPLAKRENIGRTQDFAAGRNRWHRLSDLQCDEIPSRARKSVSTAPTEVLPPLRRAYLMPSARHIRHHRIKPDLTEHQPRPRLPILERNL